MVATLFFFWSSNTSIILCIYHQWGDFTWLSLTSSVIDAFSAFLIW